MLEAVRVCLTKYAVFSGRARRSEYWWFALFNCLVTIVVGVADLALGTEETFGQFGALGGPTFLILLLPGLTVACRRLHDIDKSGWWQLLMVVPVVGVLVLLVWWCQDSKPANRYGPNPKGGIAAAYPYEPYYPR